MKHCISCLIYYMKHCVEYLILLLKQMLLEGEINNAKMSSFSSDLQTLIKHLFPLYFLYDILMSLKNLFTVVHLKVLDFLCSFNASTTWNTAGIKILTFFKVALMVCLFTCGWEDWGKHRINGQIHIINTSVFQSSCRLYWPNLLPFRAFSPSEVDYFLFFTTWFDFVVISGVIISCHLWCMFSRFDWESMDGLWPINNIKYTSFVPNIEAHFSLVNTIWLFCIIYCIRLLPRG